MREKVFCGRSDIDLEIQPAPHPRDHFSSRSRRDKQKKSARAGCIFSVRRSSTFPRASHRMPHALIFCLFVAPVLHHRSSINHSRILNAALSFFIGPD
jgi:hypothetical protein